MLRLDKLETVAAEATSASADAGVAAPVREKRCPKRLPLLDHLPRHEMVHAAPQGRLRRVRRGHVGAGKDVIEVLEYVPGHFGGAKRKRICFRCGAMAIYSAAGRGWGIMRRQGRRTR